MDSDSKSWSPHLTCAFKSDLLTIAWSVANPAEEGQRETGG